LTIAPSTQADRRTHRSKRCRKTSLLEALVVATVVWSELEVDAARRSVHDPKNANIRCPRISMARSDREDKLTLLDTPGSSISRRSRAALDVATSRPLVSAVDGVQETSSHWDLAREADVPVVIFVNALDANAPISNRHSPRSNHWSVPHRAVGIAHR